MDEQREERDLVARAREGDESAFAEIVARYKLPILDFIYRMVGNAETANDLAQEVFVRLWRSLAKFEQRPQASFSTWLFQIARNACIDLHRRSARDPLHAAVTDWEAIERHGSHDSVTDDIAEREISAQIAAAVARLPEDQRTALILSEYEGFSYLEIAKVMDCSVKSVESRLYRARQVLRRELAGLYGRVPPAGEP